MRRAELPSLLHSPTTTTQQQASIRTRRAPRRTPSSNPEVVLPTCMPFSRPHHPSPLYTQREGGRMRVKITSVVVACAAMLAASPASAFMPFAARPSSCATKMSAATEDSSSSSSSTSSASSDAGVSRRDLVKTTTVAAAALSAVSVLGGSAQPATAATNSNWEQVTDLPMGATLYDMDFDSKDPSHGWIVGSKGTFLETTDAGNTWVPRSFVDLDPDEEVTYRFERVSFKDGEGWIIGKPPILLHTQDAGKSWERIPLSPKLPGEPSTVFATGPSSAEMTTSTGAVYKTTNAGRNWKAQVKETIDATLNRISASGVQGASYFTGSIISVVRDEVSGAYLAVSSRGNFFLTWVPGEDFWVPHNRGTSRRIQNMGFVKGDNSNGVWMSLNGGLLQVSEPAQDLSSSDDQFKFADSKIRSGGYGILDVCWKDEKEVWAVGGGGSMFVSRDGGKTFTFNKSADNIPGNLYKVKFFGDKGFVLGSEGVLLRYKENA